MIPSGRSTAAWTGCTGGSGFACGSTAPASATSSQNPCTPGGTMCCRPSTGTCGWAWKRRKDFCSWSKPESGTARAAQRRSTMSILFEPVGVGSVSPVTGTGTTQKIFQSSLTAGGAYTLNALGSNRLNGKKFGVRMSGNAIGPTASTTLQLQLLCLVPGQSVVIVAQSTARTLATNVYEPWT